VSGLARWLKPSLADCLFISLLAWLFFAGPDGWSRLLLDGDTGWHIRAGEWMLEHGAVPRTDLFSFTKPGAPWYAWEWMADVIYALLHRALGLKGVVLLGGVQIALFATLLLRWTIWRGANTLVALGVGMLAVGASSIHYLARPHLYTLTGMVVALWIIEADRRQPGGRIWLLVPMAALWTNLHGGFLALITCLGCLTAGVAIEEWVGDGRRRPWPVARYGLLTVAAAAATLANPYGVRLHAHVFEYLRSDWIRDAIQEFQSPRFRNENILQFEALLLAGLMTAASLVARRKIVEALWILVWAHQALGSVRHVTIYVTVTAPLVALELSYWWTQWVAPAGRRAVRRILDEMARDAAPGFRRTSLWPALVVAALVVVEEPIRWPKDFPEERFPVALVERHAGEIAGLRVFTDDQWADYLIYRFYPRHRVYVDGRSDFYGPELGKEYLRASQAQYDWREILDRHGFDSALAPASWPVTSLLKRDADWRLLADDGKALLFVRRQRLAWAARPAIPTGLMKTIRSAETPRGDFLE